MAGDIVWALLQAEAFRGDARFQALLSDIFTTVVCNEDVVHKKPHPEGLLTAMRHLGKEPEVCCYVGDSPDDIEMGRRAKVRTIGIPGSYPNSQRIRNAMPDDCFDSLVQLLAHF